MGRSKPTATRLPSPPIATMPMREAGGGILSASGAFAEVEPSYARPPASPAETSTATPGAVGVAARPRSGSSSTPNGVAPVFSKPAGKPYWAMDEPEEGELSSEAEADDVCQVCMRPDEARHMVMCDGCFEGYHVHCMTPKRMCAPRGSWFCPKCFSFAKTRQLNLRDVKRYLDPDEDNGALLCCIRCDKPTVNLKGVRKCTGCRLRFHRKCVRASDEKKPFLCDTCVAEKSKLNTPGENAEATTSMGNRPSQIPSEAANISNSEVSREEEERAVPSAEPQPRKQRKRTSKRRSSESEPPNLSNGTPATDGKAKADAGEPRAQNAKAAESAGRDARARSSARPTRPAVSRPSHASEGPAAKGGKAKAHTNRSHERKLDGEEGAGGAPRPRAGTRAARPALRRDSHGSDAEPAADAALARGDGRVTRAAVANVSSAAHVSDEEPAPLRAVSPAKRKRRSTPTLSPPGKRPRGSSSGVIGDPPALALAGDGPVSTPSRGVVDSDSSSGDSEEQNVQGRDCLKESLGNKTSAPAAIQRRKRGRKCESMVEERSLALKPAVEENAAPQVPESAPLTGLSAVAKAASAAFSAVGAALRGSSKPEVETHEGPPDASMDGERQAASAPADVDNADHSTENEDEDVRLGAASLVAVGHERREQPTASRVAREPTPEELSDAAVLLASFRDDPALNFPSFRAGARRATEGAGGEQSSVPQNEATKASGSAQNSPPEVTEKPSLSREPDSPQEANPSPRQLTASVDNAGVSEEASRDQPEQQGGDSNKKPESSLSGKVSKKIGKKKGKKGRKQARLQAERRRREASEGGSPQEAAEIQVTEDDGAETERGVGSGSKEANKGEDATACEGSADPVEKSEAGGNATDMMDTQSKVTGEEQFRKSARRSENGDRKSSGDEPTGRGIGRSGRGDVEASQELADRSGKEEPEQNSSRARVVAGGTKQRRNGDVRDEPVNGQGGDNLEEAAVGLKTQSGRAATRSMSQNQQVQSRNALSNVQREVVEVNRPSRGNGKKSGKQIGGRRSGRLHTSNSSGGDRSGGAPGVISQQKDQESSPGTREEADNLVETKPAKRNGEEDSRAQEALPRKSKDARIDMKAEGQEDAPDVLGDKSGGAGGDGPTNQGRVVASKEKPRVGSSVAVGPSGKDDTVDSGTRRIGTSSADQNGVADSEGDGKAPSPVPQGAHSIGEKQLNSVSGDPELVANVVRNEMSNRGVEVNGVCSFPEEGVKLPDEASRSDGLVSPRGSKKLVGTKDGKDSASGNGQPADEASLVPQLLPLAPPEAEESGNGSAKAPGSCEGVGNGVLARPRFQSGRNNPGQWHSVTPRPFKSRRERRESLGCKLTIPVPSHPDRPVLVDSGNLDKWLILNVCVGKPFHFGLFMCLPNQSFFEDTLRAVFSPQGLLRAVAFAKRPATDFDTLRAWWIRNREAFDRARDRKEKVNEDDLEILPSGL